MPEVPFFIFDLDGTLVDNVYEHVLAWKAALEEEGIVIPTWRVHRRIGMSGSLLVRELAQELDASVTDACVERTRKRHGEIFKSFASKGRALPGAAELLAHLTGKGIAWAIATSGHAENASAALSTLNVDLASAVVVTRDQVRSAKPEPDLFLEAAKRLNRPVQEALVVGDSIWDMMAAKRAGATGIGVLSGGYSNAELTEVGAALICDDPADLMLHVDDLLATVRA